MTVSELIAELQKHPVDAAVRIMSFETTSDNKLHRVGEDGMDDWAPHDIVSVEDGWDHDGTDETGQAKPAVSIQVCRNPDVVIVDETTK